MMTTDDSRKRMEKFRRWWRFNLVGGIGIAVQLCLLYVFHTISHLNFLLATALAVEAAVIHNFLWHERFTWRDRLPSPWKKSFPRLLRFNLANGVISIGANLALMKALVGVGHVNYLMANITAIGICSRPPTLAFNPAASISATMPTGVPPPCTQPIKPG